MSTFTKGPWHIKAHTANSPAEITAGCDWTVYGADETMVCFEGGRTDSAAANASLIAAAPDLYEALKELIDMDVAYQRGQKVSDAVDKARAALAKAKGKS